ncbi:hypothetical protein [Halalkalibacter hemicellulosilyticus]|uniref:Uncharacterized protein n=1 Tax=Halalkalibacter hemicellulosilyticusJCM 9152 TaxID=1236971 RepID=W4QI36_9BACI|nr:hypothetical protein [Halalkalibacter hemicellulosilyticus]GAE31795.1 hypothetical protein JCM9152_3287 [Halalkalibacter hemicellulosilyticusJCM 9152]
MSEQLTERDLKDLLVTIREKANGKTNDDLKAKDVVQEIATYIEKFQTKTPVSE